MLAGHVGDDLEFARVEQTAGGVVRIVEDHRPGLRADRGLDRGAVDPPCGRFQRHFDRRRPSPPDHRRIAVIGGREDHHLVARAHRRQDRGAERLGRAAGHAQLVGRDIELLLAPIMVRHRLAQRHHPARRRILVRSLFDRARGRLKDLIRPAEIGKALPQIDRAVFRGEAGHALEHAGLHLLVKWVHGAAIASDPPCGE